MGHTIIASDTPEGRGHWLEARRFFLTASELGKFTQSSMVPNYARQSKDEIIQPKLTGERSELPLKSRAPARNGSYDEAHNLTKLGLMLGVPVAQCHAMMVNERWPYISCTLDGICIPRFMGEPDLSFARIGGHTYDTAHRVVLTRDSLISTHVGQVLVEMKQTDMHLYPTNSTTEIVSTSKGPKPKKYKEFIDRSPPGHYHQINCQMAIGEIHELVLGAQLGAGQMTAWFHEFAGLEFEQLMDETNAEAEKLLAPIAGARERFLGLMGIEL